MLTMRLWSCRMLMSCKPVTVDEGHVGEKAGLAEFVGHPHDLSAKFGRWEERFLRAVAEQVDEVLEVVCIGAVRGPGVATELSTPRPGRNR